SSTGARPSCGASAGTVCGSGASNPCGRSMPTRRTPKSCSADARRISWRGRRSSRRGSRSSASSTGSSLSARPRTTNASTDRRALDADRAQIRARAREFDEREQARTAELGVAQTDAERRNEQRNDELIQLAASLHALEAELASERARLETHALELDEREQALT